MFQLPFLLLALCAQHIVAVNPVVDLGYAKYRGISKDKGVIQWAGMRYARSVSQKDGMRFAAPQDPLPEKSDTVIDASKFGPLCIDTNVKLSEVGGKQSEDCLFANVFAPADATDASKLPVYVFIQGGGFNGNGNADYDGSDLIKAAGGKMVVVNFNYRVGPYGFLASKEIAGDKSLSLNNGLKDQRQLLKWVKAHISKFGGDPNHITLGGASAGAGSVVFQLTAYSGRDDKLFHAAFAESPAFPPLRTVAESQFQYDALLKQTGCKDLKCMREMDVEKFQNAVQSLKMPFPGASAPPIYFWNPTLDYDFISDYTYKQIEAGKFIKVPTILGVTTNDGLGFTPNSITSQSAAESFLRNQFTGLNVQKLRTLWSDKGLNPQSDDRWKNITADVYGHIRYTCGSLKLSGAYANLNSANTQAYQYRWNFGSALHVSELHAVWHNGATAAGVFLHGYAVSFIRSFDPNQYKTRFVLPGGAAMEAPVWEQFGKQEGRRIVFGNENRVGMEGVGWEEKMCGVVGGMGVMTGQTPLDTSTPLNAAAPAVSKAPAFPAKSATPTIGPTSVPRETSAASPLTTSWLSYLMYLTPVVFAAQWALT